MHGRSCKVALTTALMAGEAAVITLDARDRFGNRLRAGGGLPVRMLLRSPRRVLEVQV